MEAVPMKVPGLYRIAMTLHRGSGEEASWYRQNRSFLTALRKRFLIWRMFSAELKAKYAVDGEKRMGEKPDG